MAKDYWRDRDAEAQNNLTDKNIKEVEEQLARYYKNTMRDVVRSMGDTYQHLLDSMEAGRLPTPADLYKLDKFWKLQGQIQHRLEVLGDKELDALSRAFVSQYQDIYNSYALVDAKGTYNRIDDAAVKQMTQRIWCADGKSWSDRVWGNTKRLQEMLNNELLHCAATGKTTSQLKENLQKEFGVSYNRARTIVNTEMAHIQTEAARDRYKAYGIEEVEIYAEPDACEGCKELEGKKFSIYEQMPLPLHPNCRCCILPIINFDKEKGQSD